MTNINGSITKTVFNLNTKNPTQTDMNVINAAINMLQAYVVNVENCGYPEKCQSTACQSCQTTTCQSCQANPNCCSSGDDDGSNY